MGRNSQVVGGLLRPFIPVVFVSIAILGGGPGQLLAQQTPPPASSPIDDRENGEEEQIRLRREWFFSTRRAGTVSAKDLARLRHAGVKETRAALEAQGHRRSMDVESGQNQWVSMGPSPSTFGGWTFGNISGRVPSLAADWAGGVLYAGTASGGLWKSTDDGVTWTHLFDSAGTQTVGTVAIDPNDPNVIWAGTGENVSSCEAYFGIGLLRSADGGVTWKSRNGTGGSTLDDLASFANVMVDPRDSNRIVTGGKFRGCSQGAQQNGGLYTSDDGGLTWTPRIANTAVYEIARDPAVLDILWAGTNRGVYKSEDNGVTWTLQTNSGLPSGNTGRTELAIAPSDGNTVYALFSSIWPAFWRTTDGGATWTEMSSGGDACDGQCGYNMVLRVHGTDPDIVYRGTIHIFKSSDGGANWTDLSNNWGSSQKVHQDTHDLLMDPNDPDTFYVGCDGGVWKTTDGGDSFTNLNGNLNVTQFYAIGVRADDPGTICGGAQDNSSLARTTSNIWDLQQVTGDGFVCHIDPQDADYAYIASYPSVDPRYPRVLRSKNGLLGTFSLITGSGSGINSGDRSNWVTPYVIDPTSPHILYLGTHRVYKSDDHGDTWTDVGPSDLTNASGSLHALEVNRNYPNVVYSGSGSGRVWRTVNSGTDWVDITAGLPARSINDVAGDPTNPDRAFAVVGGFNTAHLWEWTAGGGWVERGGDLPNVPANTVLMLTDRDILVGSDTGIFRSFDGGVSFEPYMYGLPEGLVVTDLKYNLLQNVVTAGTYGRGAWQVSVAPDWPPHWQIDRVNQCYLPLDGEVSLPGEGRSVTVFIVGTGINGSDPSFGGRVTAGFDAHGGDPWVDPDGRGTTIARVVGSSMCGAAPGVDLVPVKVTDGLGGASISSITAGLDYIHANHSGSGVVLLTFPTAASYQIDDRVGQLENDGLVVIVAAGDDARDACELSPARTYYGITVGGTDVTDSIADASNRGPCVDLFAPAVDVPACDADTIMSGTAFGAAVAAGAAAVHLEAPGTSGYEVKQALLDDATQYVVFGDLMGGPNRLLHMSSAPCGATGSCSPPTPIYLATEELCVECIDSSHCGGSTPSCSDRACVECTLDSDCPVNHACAAGNRCVAVGPHHPENMASAHDRIVDDATLGVVSDPGTGSPNRLLYLDGRVSGPSPGNWGLDRANQRMLPLDNNGSVASAGLGVHVYVLDTGIHRTHQVFSGRADCFHDWEPGNDCADGNGHGTWVASLVAGETYGWANDAMVHAVRVSNDLGGSTVQKIKAGLDAIATGGEIPGVVVLPIGGAVNDEIDAAVQRVVDAGYYVVAAANNEDADACNGSPSRVPEILTVGATDQNDTRSSFSNWGSCVDLFAPGSDITGAWHTSDTSTSTKSGTPAAAAFVAGAVAVHAGRGNLLAAEQAGLEVSKDPAGFLTLDWSADCGAATTYGIYRGDLRIGYDSIVAEPGACDVTGTAATIPLGPGDADFFLAVPNQGGVEGSYGTDSSGTPRPPATGACYPQGAIDFCLP